MTTGSPGPAGPAPRHSPTPPGAPGPVPGQRTGQPPPHRVASAAELDPAWGWAPQTEAEAGMAKAVAARDQLGYLAALAGGALLLPLSDAAAAGREPAGWATGTVDGTRYVLAFTSRAALPPERRGQVCWVSLLFDVVAAIGTRGYGLAVDPGLPIQVFLGPGAVADLRPWEALWCPTEATLRAAVIGEDPVAYLSELLTTTLVLPLPTAADSQPPGVAPAAAAEEPGDYWSRVVRSDPEPMRHSRDITDPHFVWWRAERADGVPVIFAFTSPIRMQAEVGERDWIEVPFLDIVDARPDQRCALRLNSGGANGMELPGSALVELRERYRALRREQETG